jgi:DNA polymerase-3 subunit gamma/tau
LTSAASSALLKTLEEPPGHVIFVLATTDPQKVMETIRSRTQHFEFRLLGPNVLAAHLADVAKQASLDVSAEAIDLAVRRGYGSVRDALSALDQVAAGGAVDEVSAVVDIVDAMVAKDPGAVLVAVAEAARAGVDPRRLGTELLEYLRNGFLATRAPALVMLTEPAAAEVEARARQLGSAALVRAMEVIGGAVIDIREAADPRTTLEVALVKLSAPELDDSRAALLERIERLERAAGPGNVVPMVPPQAVIPAVTSIPPPPPRPGPGGGPAAPKAALGAHRTAAAPASSGSIKAEPPSAPAQEPAPAAAPTTTTPPGRNLPTRDELTLAWGDRILPALRPAVKVYLAAGRFLAPADGQAVYAVPDRGLLQRAQPSVAEVEAALAAYFGRPIPLNLVLDDGSVAPPPVDAAADSRQEAEDIDLSELEDAPGEVMSPEQRLLEAFPGAEEVTYEQ